MPLLICINQVIARKNDEKKNWKNHTKYGHVGTYGTDNATHCSGR